MVVSRKTASIGNISLHKKENSPAARATGEIGGQNLPSHTGFENPTFDVAYVSFLYPFALFLLMSLLHPVVSLDEGVEPDTHVGRHSPVPIRKSARFRPLVLILEVDREVKCPEEDESQQVQGEFLVIA